MSFTVLIAWYTVIAGILLLCYFFCSVGPDVDDDVRWWLDLRWARRWCGAWLPCVGYHCDVGRSVGFFAVLGLVGLLNSPRVCAIV